MEVKRLKVYAVNDDLGAAGMTADEEVEHTLRHLRIMLGKGVQLDLAGRAGHFHEVPEGVDILLFDYGGAANMYASTLWFDRCGEVLRWAEDHPSALVVVTSSYTWQAAEYEWQERLEQEHGERPANLVPLHDWRVRAKGENELAHIAGWLGITLTED